MSMYVENLKLFSVKFLELKCENNSVDKKINTQKSIVFSLQQMMENRNLKRYPK